MRVHKRRHLETARSNLHPTCPQQSRPKRWGCLRPEHPALYGAANVRLDVLHSTVLFVTSQLHHEVSA
jgi:hypothetical protein